MEVDEQAGSYVDLSERFQLAPSRRSTAVTQQFFRLYRARLAAVKPRLLRAVDDAFAQGDRPPVCSLADMREGERCVVVGTLVKQQKLRPSVLKQLADEEGLVVSGPLVGTYASDDDRVRLADEQQSAELTGDLPVDQLVTGVVVAICGVPASNGDFVVERIIMPQMIPRGLSEPEQDADSCVCLVSGLRLGGAGGRSNGEGFDDAASLMAGHLLAQFVTAGVADAPSHRRPLRMIVAGDSFPPTAATNQLGQAASPVRHMSRRAELPVGRPAQNVDHFLANLAAHLPVDVMPGQLDPTSQMWPQQRMHKCLFPNAAQFSDRLRTVPNPYACRLAGRLLLGTSGGNVTDVVHNSRNVDPLQALKSILHWQHLCPTAPDTMDAYPCDADPFILDERDGFSQPDVLFAGNQPQLAHEVVELNGRRTLLLCLPVFADSNTAVFVNLRTLQVQPVVCSLRAVGA